MPTHPFNGTKITILTFPLSETKLFLLFSESCWAGPCHVCDVTASHQCTTLPHHYSKQSVLSAASLHNITVAATQVFSFYHHVRINLCFLFLSYSHLVPKTTNQSDQCKYLSIEFATHLTHTELLGQWFELQLPFGDKLKTGSFLGKQIQQTTTRTKTFARGIQNKQFTQVRPCWRGWELNIELTMRIIHSHTFFYFLFTDEMAKLHFLTTQRCRRWTEHWAVLEKKAYLVSFYEKQYQRNTGNKKNIMAVLSMPYSVLRGDFRMMNND